MKEISIPYSELVYEIDGHKYIVYVHEDQDICVDKKSKELYLTRYARWEMGGNKKIHNID